MIPRDVVQLERVRSKGDSYQNDNDQVDDDHERRALGRRLRIIAPFIQIYRVEE